MLWLVIERIINNSIVLIGIGGAIGAIARYELGGFVQNTLKPDYLPIGTLAVNVLGSFFLGVIFTLFQYNYFSQSNLLLFGTGFCGAFTTFSTFAVETINLVTQASNWGIVNILLNLFFTLIAVIVGIITANIIVQLLSHSLV